MSHENYPRVNIFDGQQISEQELDTEQTAWHGTIANVADVALGSGVEKEYSVQRVLFDTNSVPTSVQTLISSQSFDGEPLYETDSFSNVIFLQPSDSTQGNQLELEISGSSLEGSATLKVFLFGTTFGGEFTQEVVTFDTNTTRVTRNYFTSLVAIMSQDFKGNQNTLVTGTASRNNGGRLRILEALPMAVARDTIMVSQDVEPNQDYINFKPATLFKTLDTLLDEISLEAGLNKDDLGINTTASDTRQLEANQVGVIVAQKFKATSNNIQKVSILLSVEERELVAESVKFDWTGSIVVGIRALQTTTSCPTDIIPNAAIEFDPEPAPIAEVSFDKADLAARGIVLNDTPQIVDFVFTQSLLANPNISPNLVPGNYYAITIRRTGNISTGNLILQVAANTAPTGTVDDTRMSVFSQNIWTDFVENDLWFRIHTDAIRIVDGTAIDAGVLITSPKVKENISTGANEPYVEGDHSLINTAGQDYNYVIVQKSNEFSDVVSHPSTGNSVFSRISDVPEVSVISETSLTTLISAGNEPIVLGAVKDTNPTVNETITGVTAYPGLARSNTITIINPSSDLLVDNVIGSIITPNVDEPDLQYRIINKEVFVDAYGDIDGSGTIDASDVTRCLEIGDVVAGDGYSVTLQAGSLSSVIQLHAIETGTVTMEEILRADVAGSGLISTTEASLIQQYIALGTAFPAGTTFNRVVLTVENITNPLTTSPDILGSDSAFNLVPFSPITYRISFVPLWSESNIIITDLRRFVPRTFTEIETSDITGDLKNGGKNTFFVPGDLMISGDLLDGYANPFKVDMEVATIDFVLPSGDTAGEVDIFNNYVKNIMRFSDGTFVGSSAISNNQIRVTTSISSIYREDGYSVDDSTESVSVLYTSSSGLLRINATNVKNSAVSAEKKTRIILTVYLKKAGFRNDNVSVSDTDLADVLVVL